MCCNNKISTKQSLTESTNILQDPIGACVRSVSRSYQDLTRIWNLTNIRSYTISYIRSY